MTKLVNRAKMTTATTGTGTISLSGAVDGYQTFANAGVVNSDVVRYTIEDGTAWEIGSGTYSSGTLTRVLDESSTGSLLNLSGDAVVYVTAAGEDLQFAANMDQGVATTDDPTFTNTQIAAIAESKGVTAVDVFVYDTSKDSDGGAWRKRMQNRSWYATNGDFPSATVILATASSVIVYSADDPTLPIWTTEDYTGLSITSVSALNGKIVIGTTTGVIVSDYVLDNLGSTALDYTTSTSPAIVNNSVNDVAMTVLSGAPIDAATGLAVPTIAVATAGGVSVINNDGTVADSTTAVAMRSVSFGQGGRLFYQRDLADQNDIFFADTYASDGFNASEVHYDNDTVPYILAGTGADTVASNEAVYFGCDAGLVLIDEDQSTQANGMVAWVASDYNTGWMQGDIKGAFLSSTDTASLVGGTDDDRSTANNPLTVNGTITRTPVATGAELVGYSGFSASNYLEQPYNSDLDFGTGDFCVMGWAKPTTTGSQTIFDRANADGVTGTNRFVLLHISGSGWQFFIKGAASTQNLTVGSNAATNVWQHVCALRTGGSLFIYVNGELAASGASTAQDVSNTSAVSRVGLAFNDTSPFNAGSLALLRIGATAPTATQIKKIYEDEKFLFQENAAATLYGASDAVTALAHDDATNLLHVGTSAGRSVFQGLRRVSNTTTAVGTAISASNNLVVEE